MIPEFMKNSRLVRGAVLPALDRRRTRAYMDRAEAAPGPEILQIEPTAACNLKCVMCFRESNRFPPAPMGFDLYRKIIDDSVACGVRKVRLYFRGEPLLHPKIADMAAYAAERGHRDIELNTNGQLLDERAARALVAAGVSHLFVSIEGHTAAQYESIRRGGSFDRLLENIRAFNRVRLEAASPIKCTLITVNMKGNEFPNEQFHEFWREHFDDILVVGMVSHGRLDNPKLMLEGNKPSAAPCLQLWTRLVVMSDGTAPLCCSDITGDYVLGNLADQSIRDVWQGEPLRKIRAAHRARKRNQIPMCAGCTFME